MEPTRPGKKEATGLRTISFACLIALVAGCATPEGITPAIPGPAEVIIRPPPAGLAPELAAYSGIWEGVWSVYEAMVPARLIVQRIDAESALVIYAWGDNSAGRFSFKAGWAPRRAVVLPGPKLEFGWPEVKYTVEMGEDRTTLRIRSERVGFANHTTMKKIRGADPGRMERYGMTYDEANDAIVHGEGPAALAYYERRARELDEKGERQSAGVAYNAAAMVAMRLDFQGAVRNGLRAIDLLKGRNLGDTLEREDFAHLMVGFGYFYSGNLNEAEHFFEKGRAIIPPDSPGQIAAFARGLSRVAMAQGDFVRAASHAQQAVELSQRLLQTRPQAPTPLRERWQWSLATSLQALAEAQRQSGDLTGAEETLNSALREARAVRAPEIETWALVTAGEVYLARKEFHRALEAFNQALSLATPRRLTAVSIVALAGVARTYQTQGSPAEAIIAYREAIDLLEGVRGQLQETELRSTFLEDKQLIYHGAVQAALALGNSAEAFSYAERGRARVFLDLLGNQTTLSKGKTRALVEEELRLRVHLSEARAIAPEVGGVVDADRARQQVEAAERAYRAFLERVREENLEQASLMTVEPITLEEIQGLLPEGTTLLEYLVTEHESLLWVIDRSRIEVVRLPIARRLLVEQVRAFRMAIAEQGEMERVRVLATALYERLLLAARPHIRGDRLLIAPHDVLHYLPFGALRSTEGRWLVQDYTLSTLPSASVLKYLQDKGQGVSDRVLAVGNPDLGPALALRYAEREARAVGERYPGATVLTRQAATEAKVKAVSSEMGLLHFATHGELNEQDPLSSALLLVPGGNEDGRLEVRELFGLDLNARLVVLSACETGLGMLSRGDELVGLQRAFLYAGTPAVVTTLWKVDDRASFLLMREFYDQLKTRGPAEALRQAQTQVVRDFPHPFSWAAFVLTGVPR